MPLFADVTAVSRDPNSIDLFVSDNSTAIQTIRWTNGWGNWTPVQLPSDGHIQVSPGAPVVALATPNHMNIVIDRKPGNWAGGPIFFSNCGTAAREAPGRAIGAQSIPTISTDNPYAPVAAIIALAPDGDHLELFAVSSAQKIVTYGSNVWGGGSHPDQGLSPGNYWASKDITGDLKPNDGTVVTAVARTDEGRDVFLVGPNNTPYTLSRTTVAQGFASTWTSIGSASDLFPAGAPITVISRNPAQMDLFAVRIDGGVYWNWSELQPQQGRLERLDPHRREFHRADDLFHHRRRAHANAHGPVRLRIRRQDLHDVVGRGPERVVARPHAARSTAFCVVAERRGPVRHSEQPVGFGPAERGS